jgi:transcriptional regulator with XRE-family HTH domain
LIISKLQEVREAKGISRGELALKCVITTETIRRAEAGGSVTYSTALRLAKGLKVDVADIRG